MKLLLECLVERGKTIVAEHGMEALLQFKANSYACGCMGPRGNEPLCPCEMRHALEENLLSVVYSIDKDAAKQLFRKRLVESLSMPLIKELT